MKKTMFIWVVVAILALGGCAAMEKGGTTFEPVRIEDGAQVFRYKAMAGVNSAHDSPDAEALRMEMLRIWLDENGLTGQPYEILTRQAVVKTISIFGPVHEIFYEVRVPKKSP